MGLCASRVGVVGLGSDWEQRLSPAIEKMQARVRVVAVCDDIAISAQAAISISFKNTESEDGWQPTKVILFALPLLLYQTATPTVY